MILSMESTVGRAVFLVIVIAISSIFLLTAFIIRPDWNQQPIVIYLVVAEALVILTFFLYRKQGIPRTNYVKRLKNPRLQENSFELARLLLKEFDYIRDTAAQAMNDRHTMVNYFLLITGAFFTIIGNKFFSSENVFEDLKYIKIIVGISIIITVIGWVYFMHIIRLRQAWCDSAAAMNQIKEFCVVNGRVPDDIARSAFLWSSRTIPRAGKKSNVSYYSAMLIGIVSAFFVFFASWLLSPEGKQFSISLFTWLIAIYHFLFQMSCYSLFLDYKPAIEG